MCEFVFFFNDTATTEIYTYATLFPYTTLFRSVALAGVILDLKIIAHGGELGVAFPPFPENTLRPIRALHAPAHAAPVERHRRMIGQKCHRQIGRAHV